MVSTKSMKRAKKPIETTLGQSQTCKEKDVSHLRKPIATSINSINKLISILESATSEVRDILMYECDIMFECKICRTIFRSLANFILHKRKYCLEKWVAAAGQVNNMFELTVDQKFQKPKSGTLTLGNIIEKLHEIGQIRESAKKLLTVDLTSESENGSVKNVDDCEVVTSHSNSLVLEKIDNNSSGAFQTLINKQLDDTNARGEFMKLEVMENHKKIENDVPILDDVGKICNFTSSIEPQPTMYPKSDLKCLECNNRFATKKSLSNHIKMVHNPSRILYVCPICKELLANPWCVYRHLLKVHKKTNKQVRKMREQVHSSTLRRGELISTQKRKLTGVNAREERDSQWINDIEGDKDFQMCAGCGKHFDRKAALHSHSQMCAKRLEICNNIKENAKQKEAEETVQKARLDKVADHRASLKGAVKRKGQIILDYRSKTCGNFGEVEGDSKMLSLRNKNMSTMSKEEMCKESVESNNMSQKNDKPVAEFPPIQSRNLHENDLNSQVADIPPSPSSSCRIISRSNSAGEAVWLSSSDESDFGSPQSSKSSGMIDGCSQNEKCFFETTMDLLSTDVSFEAFCDKIDTLNNATGRPKKGKRELELGEEHCSAIPVNPSNVKDVNFVSEHTTLRRLSEEFSSLSHNTHLKTNVKPFQERTCSNADEENLKIVYSAHTENVKSETDFISRVSPYMNREKLLCIPCGTTFKSPSLLFWHMSAHFSWFRFQCGKCSFVTFNKFDCSSHVRNEHQLNDRHTASYVLPLPSWKSVLMSHSFRYLTDPALKGRHTDEKIDVDERPKKSKKLPSCSTGSLLAYSLFGEVSGEDSERNNSSKNELSTKKRKCSIDIEEAGLDSHQLPKPVELTMPADVSEILRSASLEQESSLLDTTLHHSSNQCANEYSSDKSQLKAFISKEQCESIKTIHSLKPPFHDDLVKQTKRIRTARIRTKTKQDSDFVYYNNTANTSRIADSFKSDILKVRLCKSGKLGPVTRKKNL